MEERWEGEREGGILLRGLSASLVSCWFESYIIMMC